MRTIPTLFMVIISSLFIFSLPNVNIFIKLVLFIFIVILYDKNSHLLASWFNNKYILNIFIKLVILFMGLDLTLILVLSFYNNKLRSTLPINVNSTEWNKIIVKSMELTAWSTQLYIWETIFLISLLSLLLIKRRHRTKPVQTRKY
jgi:hypothetical protein